MNDYKTLKTVEALPHAASMIETFRAIGYSLETAVADIVDNSISATAKTIEIKRQWNGGQSSFVIIDDGLGMNGNEIIDALRPGSSNPLDDRDKNDLGRFGLGLKTASFSQCRKLTVVSKKSGYSKVYWTWDLDYVAQTNEWKLIQWIPEEYKDVLNDRTSGTAVIWTELDRILPLDTSPTNEAIKTKFSAAFKKVRLHLGMIFHKFIEEGLDIIWGEHSIEAWNPFCTSEGGTQLFSTEYLPGNCTIKGYVLPHKNKFSSEDAYNKAQGINGWNAQQGFYVYRGKRLLLAGDWLGLFRKADYLKLARIEIDIPNNLDTEWQIDIKKSKAIIPIGIRDNIKAYSNKVIACASEVYRHRGKILKQKAGHSFQPLWLDKSKDEKWSFVINRDNEIVQETIAMAQKDPKEAFEHLFRFIESTLPTKTIYIKESENESEKSCTNNLDESIVRNMITTIFENKIKEGLSSEQAKIFIRNIEPLNNYEYIIDEL